jgi:hypothetical protein
VGNSRVIHSSVRSFQGLQTTPRRRRVEVEAEESISKKILTQISFGRMSGDE